MSKIQSGGLYFAKKSDDLTWNDPMVKSEMATCAL